MLESQPLGEELRRARRTVPDDDDIDVVRLEDERGVLERLAFDEARTARGNVDHVRAQAHRGQLKRRARARARLDEEVDQRAAAQGGHFFHVARADFLELLRGVEQEGDFLRARVPGCRANPCAARGPAERGEREVGVQGESGSKKENVGSQKQKYPVARVTGFQFDPS